MNISNSDMLMRMQVDAFKAAGIEKDSPIAGDNKGFSEVLKSAIGNVTEAQENSKIMSERFAIGDKNVSIVDAKMASEVAEVKTQILIASTQKILKAYRDISTMSI
jgi:flagellar hook-basal body complex protein FliE